MFEDDPDTQDQNQNADADADAQNQDSDRTDTDADGGGDDAEKKPFLKVDDRTIYWTEDDARKGGIQAGQRIAQLSKWEKIVAKKYGITDPTEAAALLDELVARRQGKWKDSSDQRTDSSRSDDRGADPNKPDPYAGLSEEEKKSAKWLEQKGWMRREAIEKMFDERIAKLKEEFSGQLTERDETAVFNTRVKEGQTVLADLLKEAGLPNSPKHVRAAELYLTDAFFGEEADPDKERYNALLAGGDELKRVLAEGFKVYKTDLIDSLRTKQDADYEKKKTDAINRGGKPLPRDAGASKKLVPVDAKKKVVPTSNEAMQSAHERAWAAMQEKD